MKDQFLITNVLGTKKIMDACKEHNIRNIIHVSTDEIYGEILNSSFDEKAKFNPSNPYSSSKAAAEMVVNGYMHSYKLPVTIVRSNNIFGTRQHPEKLIAGCCWSFIKKKYFYLHGKGKQKRTFLYVEDFCRAIYTIIKKGKKKEIYNIGSNFEFRNIDIVKLISKKCNVIFKDNVFFSKDRPFNDFRYSINYTKLSKLGWKPKNNVEDKINEIIKWYKNNIHRYPKRF